MSLSVQQRGSLFLVVTVCLLVVGVCAPFSGHDLQRAMQIAIGLCAVLYGLSVTPSECLVDRPTAVGLALIIALGPGFGAVGPSAALGVDRTGAAHQLRRHCRGFLPGQAQWR